MAKKTAASDDTPEVTQADAAELVGQTVRARGRFAGMDFCYDGILRKVHAPTGRIGAALEIATCDKQFVAAPHGDMVPFPEDCDTPNKRQAFLQHLAGPAKLVYASAEGAMVHQRREVPVVATVPLRSVAMLIDGATVKAIEEATA